MINDKLIPGYSKISVIRDEKVFTDTLLCVKEIYIISGGNDIIRTTIHLGDCVAKFSM